MRLTYEPLEAPAAAPAPQGVALLGIEIVRAVGAWPVARHVFDLLEDSGLHVEVDPLGNVQAYAVGYGDDGSEMLTVL